MYSNCWCLEKMASPPLLINLWHAIPCLSLRTLVLPRVLSGFCWRYIQRVAFVAWSICFLVILHIFSLPPTRRYCRRRGLSADTVPHDVMFLARLLSYNNSPPVG